MAAGKDSETPFSLDSYHVSEELGFILPDPLHQLPAYYQPWMDVARRVPEFVLAHELRFHVNKMPQLSVQFLQKHRQLRLAHLALGVMAMGYVWQEGEQDTVEVLPRALAVPYWEVSQRLGLPPILTHADAVLANWRKKDPEGPLELRNLELLVSIPGGESVRGFFIVTLMVEQAAIPALRNIPKVINGVRRGDAKAVAEALEVMGQSIDSMAVCLKLMQVHVEPSVFYGIMRIFLSGWKDNPCMAKGLVYEGVQTEPMEYSGGSAAQSSLLHCFDELLGVEHADKSGAFLARMRSYMLPAHRQLIRDISTRPRLRTFVRRHADERLTEAFQGCVGKLLALRGCHIAVVTRFITIPAARARRPRDRSEAEVLGRAPAGLQERGTGGSGIMSFLKTVRDQTRDALLPATSREAKRPGDVS
ncbi:indoleamine 2,3-dioxygenase 1 [Nerophis ophidion]|uniref:indoleamine 2,3-dioxygenase 1 n=1 Tax=Nerophis ophidion TaxID=159077 RepID=UPI002AE04205|nr:indoleamine 2,3-dioxygenase 1 [Nerophis ophidion]